MEAPPQPLSIHQGVNPPNGVRTAKIFPQPLLPEPGRAGCPQGIEATQASPKKHQGGFERHRGINAWQ